MNNTLKGFIIADIRGITVESCKNVSFNNVKVRKIKSFNGSVYGIDVMFKGININGNFCVSDLFTKSIRDLPSNF